MVALSLSLNCCHDTLKIIVSKYFFSICNILVHSVSSYLFLLQFQRSLNRIFFHLLTTLLVANHCHSQTASEAIFPAKCYEIMFFMVFVIFICAYVKPWMGKITISWQRRRIYVPQNHKRSEILDFLQRDYTIKVSLP